jgi:hypothetical protein
MLNPSRRYSRAALLLAALAAVAGLAAGATAGPAGTWTQITRAHSGATSNLGLARGKDGTLHVLWAGPTVRPFSAIYDTRISALGGVGGRQTVLARWSSVLPPSAVAAPDGSIDAVFSGQKTNTTDDPYAGLNEVVGPRSWKLGAHAYGSSSITVASNADVRIALLKTGDLISVWRSAASLLFQTGVDPATAPQSLKPAGTSPVVAVDQATGEAVIAYKGISTPPSLFFRRVYPAVGPAQAMLQTTRVDAPSIASRAGGGVYSAYTPDNTRVWLFRFGGSFKTVPVPKGARVLTAGIATGPEGRLWIFYGNEQQTFVTRTNKTVTAFEPVQAFKSPKAAQYFRLEGEGSLGPLDLFADVTVDGRTKDGSYQTHALPALSVAASKQTVMRQGKVTGIQVTVRVTDAGDRLQGATVTGLPGGAKTTDGTGSVTVILPPSQKGSVTITATKDDYVAAKTTLSL